MYIDYWTHFDWQIYIHTHIDLPNTFTVIYAVTLIYMYMLTIYIDHIKL